LSPVFTVFGVVKANEYRKFPAEMSSHTEMYPMTSPFVPAHVFQAGSVVVMALEPADAAAQDRITLVVTDDGFEVPAEPGSPVLVWSFAYVFVGAVNAVPLSMFRYLFARFTP
jgi:hypothetical protein